jgi:hypothetical protein
MRGLRRKAAYLLAEAERRVHHLQLVNDQCKSQRVQLGQKRCRVCAINLTNPDSVLADCQLVLSGFSLNRSSPVMEEKPERLGFGSRSRPRHTS